MAILMSCGSSSPLAVDEEGRHPDLVGFTISPESVQLNPGQTVRFTIYGWLSSSSEPYVQSTRYVDWSVTGGTITQDGLYRAGSQGGNFKVVAKRWKMSATAQVTISGSSSSPSPAPSPSLSGVRVAVGSSIQAAVDANPAGTTFVIEAGRHQRQTVVPKDGNVFMGESGAILDGEGVARYAFSGGRTSASGVRIRNLVIENYATPPADGAIHAKGTDGWVIEDSEVRYTIASVQDFGCTGPSGCGGMGIKMGSRTVVRNNYLHHNDQFGIGGGGTGSLVEGNEISYNNYRGAVRTGYGAGGSKFPQTSGLVVRNNYVHHNRGPGLWTDIENVNVLYEGNRVEDNTGPGIFHEVSHSAVIRNNTVRRNGANSSWFYGAGILVAHSDNVEVYGNVVENNSSGIVGIQQNRYVHLKNLWVHDNTVLTSGRTGVVEGEDASFDPYTATANNRFDRNSYRVSEEDPFRWKAGTQNWREWQAIGHDRAGTITGP